MWNEQAKRERNPSHDKTEKGYQRLERGKLVTTFPQKPRTKNPGRKNRKGKAGKKKAQDDFKAKNKPKNRASGGERGPPGGKKKKKKRKRKGKNKKKTKASKKGGGTTHRIEKSGLGLRKKKKRRGRGPRKKKKRGPWDFQTQRGCKNNEAERGNGIVNEKNWDKIKKNCAGEEANQD